MEVADRIAELLRSARAPLVPLGELRRQLEAASEDQPGPGDLRTILASFPGRFVVLERPAIFAGAEHWPQEERTAYAEALRAAGFETQALIGEAACDPADAEPRPLESPLSRVASSLAQLAEAAPEGLLQERLWDSLPLAEATMRALAEAWRARRGLDAGATATTAEPSG